MVSDGAKVDGIQGSRAEVKGHETEHTDHKLRGCTTATPGSRQHRRTQ
jgi:hypothetical protein